MRLAGLLLNLKERSRVRRLDLRLPICGEEGRSPNEDYGPLVWLWVLRRKRCGYGEGNFVVALLVST
jgi:hypothetical protein